MIIMTVQLATSIGIIISAVSTGAMTISHAWVYFRTNGKYGNGYAEGYKSAVQDSKPPD